MSAGWDWERWKGGWELGGDPDPASSGGGELKVQKKDILGWEFLVSYQQIYKKRETC
jgi:hypothetical protein